MNNTITFREDQWIKIITFLRACPGVYVGQETACRRFMEGVLWILRSGAQWRLLPKEYGHWNSVYKRFARWCERGIWEALYHDCIEDPDMAYVLLDSTIVRAHPCAAGALKKRWTSRPSPGTQSRRVQHQNPCQCRCSRQPFAFYLDRRTAA